MNYISTRGPLPKTGFQDAVLMGLAPDGGLIIPESWPDFTDRLDDLRRMSYCELATAVMSPFVDIPKDEFHRMVNDSYATFRHAEVTPVIEAGPVHILELFHGPTLAFKDVALQLLGRVFSRILAERGGELNILAATSGDTGSAAIHGVRGRPNIRIFVMHPLGRVSPLQEKQMTSVLDDNVFNLAVSGTFDDCQQMMKSTFSDIPFKQQYSLGAVNSVNWARVLAQMVYYFYSAFRVMDRTGSDRVQFAVPTGNFGDILAGHYAARCGLPVEKLLLATNENDILTRFFNTGIYERGDVHATISPSMDIQVASNFERFLFELAGEDAGHLNEWMQTFNRTGRIQTDPAGIQPHLIQAGRGSTVDTLRTIRHYHEKYGVLIDPHTAVGVHVAEHLADSKIPVICLATAHPAKFSAAIEKAIGCAATHPVLDALEQAPTRCDRLPAEESALRAYLAEHID